VEDNVLICVRNIDRVYNSGAEEIYALRDVNIDIPKGRLTILKGPSGSGKTTLINILGALDRPTVGNVVFNDVDITKMSDARRDNFRKSNVGFVFQSIALMSTMTAYENVEFGLRIAGVPYKEQNTRVKESLSIVGLEERMKHRIHELSGGEQQRVAIARAMAHKPVIILADEPTAELDTYTGLQVIRLFKKVIDEHGTTIVMATHDPNMMEIGDKVIDLEDGKII